MKQGHSDKHSALSIEWFSSDNVKTIEFWYMLYNILMKAISLIQSDDLGHSSGTICTLELPKIHFSMSQELICVIEKIVQTLRYELSPEDPVLPARSSCRTENPAQNRLSGVHLVRVQSSEPSSSIRDGH